MDTSFPLLDGSLTGSALPLLDGLRCYVLVQQGDIFVWANQRSRMVLGLDGESGAVFAVPVDQVMAGAYPPLVERPGMGAPEDGAGNRAGDGDGEDCRFECLLMGSDGIPRNVAGMLQPIEHEGQAARLMVAVERADGLYEGMRGHATFLEELLDSAPEAIAIINRGRILHVNHEFTRLFGFSMQQAIGSDLDELVVPEGRRHESDMLSEAVKETGRGYMETIRRTRQGELVDVSVLMAPVRIGGDEVGHFVSYRDIRHQKQVEAKLQYDALHDSLTGLANRVLFLDRLQAVMTRMVRRPDRNFAIMFLDLDGFKQVNDSLGHASGDALLLKISERLKTCLRPQDTIARFGGDEFAILLDEIVANADAAGVAERIQQTVRQPMDVFGQQVQVSASIGIALGSAEYGSAEQIMRDADYAMYSAKANGKGRHEVFDNSMHAGATVKKQLNIHLREALKGDQFEVWYQPVYWLQSGEMESMEALLRWKHPERGYVPLSEFMRMAEDTGLIMQIGHVVLEKACRQMQQWVVRRPGCKVTMNVNLSPREFGQSGLLDVVARVLRDTGLDADHLRLEITEMAVNQDPDAAVIHVQRLSDMGIRVALDNFGAGLASMNNLLRLPIELLKLDRRLTRYLPAQGRQAALIEIIFNLGRLLHMRMQADGIETEVQLEELKRYGCELGQGHLFAKALPAAEMELLLDRQVPGVSQSVG